MRKKQKNNRLQKNIKDFYDKHKLHTRLKPWAEMSGKLWNSLVLMATYSSQIFNGK